MRYFLELAAAFTGSMGFAMIFHVRREKLFLASLGGMLAWACTFSWVWSRTRTWCEASRPPSS